MSRASGRISLWRWIAFAAASFTALVMAVQLWFLGHVLYWRQANPSMTSFMEARLGSLREKNPQAKLVQGWVPYERISTHLKRAIIAAEDAKFIDHEGFDWQGIQHALDKNQRRGKVVAGGSTLTQQLAKNLFLSGERSFVR